jgi:hypothetical protein
MKASQEIREALARVAELRQVASQPGDLALALQAVKHLQAQRFAGTYADLLGSPMFSPSATFFLEELYSAKDYSDRDAQFSRIAGTIERTFPESVISTVTALARLHRLTEELDLAMARHWCQADSTSDAARYITCWRAVNQREDRNWQLATVLQIGQSLGKLTRKPGLRLLLKMMRRPAELAGLGSLQAFLESGFDHFCGMAKSGQVDTFLTTIRARESGWIDRLFDADPATCVAELTQTLPLAPNPLSPIAT